MQQKTAVKTLLKSWFPNRLNIAVALLLLPFLPVVVLGFFSMFFHGLTHSYAVHYSNAKRP